VLLLVAVTGWYLIAGGGLQRFEEHRVRAALVESGVSTRRAECMARRMVERLDLLQLWKLQNFAEKRRTLGAYIRGVKRVGDAEAIAVTVSSAGLCAVGLG